MLRVERYLLNAMPLCGAVTKLTGSRLGSAGPAPARAALVLALHTPPHGGVQARAAEGGRERLPPPPSPLSIASRKRAAPPPSPVIHFAEGCLSLSLARAPQVRQPLPPPRRFSFQKNLARASGLLSGEPPTPEPR